MPGTSSAVLRLTAADGSTLDAPIIRPTGPTCVGTNWDVLVEDLPVQSSAGADPHLRHAAGAATADWGSGLTNRPGAAGFAWFCSLGTQRSRSTSVAGGRSS